MSKYAKILLRLEGGLIGGLAVWYYAANIGNWWLFAALILVPDLSALGYVHSRRVGALTYNCFHSYIGPAALAGLSLLSDPAWLAPLAAIWIAHIGIDRLIGYGMKFDDDHKRNHLN